MDCAFLGRKRQVQPLLLRCQEPYLKFVHQSYGAGGPGSRDTQFDISYCCNKMSGKSPILAIGYSLGLKVAKIEIYPILHPIFKKLLKGLTGGWTVISIPLCEVKGLDLSKCLVYVLVIVAGNIWGTSFNLVLANWRG